MRTSPARHAWLALLVPAALIALAAGPHAAHAFDPAVSALCTEPMAETEARHEIPAHLLEAIAMVESGSWDPHARRTRAWPWTIYAEGSGRRFDTKREAIAAAAALKARGVRSIDVGCMQVNLHYHGDAFASLEDAFDPALNVAYAARFLESLRQRQRSWSRAIGHYHSATPKRSRPYHLRVTKAWSEARRHAAETRRMARLEEYRARRDAAQARREAARSESS